MLANRVDRHLMSCAHAAGGALVVAGALTSAALPSHAAAYTTTTVYSVYYYGADPGPGVVYIDVDYAPGVMLMKLVPGATPAGASPVGGLSFGSYAGFELAIGIGAYGAQLYDNPSDGVTLYVNGAVDGFSGDEYAYPFNLASGTTLDTSDAWVTGVYSIEVTSYNADWTAAAGDSGYVGFKLSDGVTSSFGYFYLYALDYLPGGGAKFITGKAAWDSTASSITIGAVVPEPSSGSLGLLAAGALGLGRWRRRRRCCRSEDGAPS